jgi:hypothetical protein
VYRRAGRGNDAISTPRWPILAENNGAWPAPRSRVGGPATKIISSSMRPVARRRPSPNPSLSTSPAVPVSNTWRQPHPPRTRPFLCTLPRRPPRCHHPPATSTTGLPLAIHRTPARTEIVVPLGHLRISPSPLSDNSRTQQMQRQAIRQGFCCESSQQARSVPRKKFPTAAELTTPLADSGACATTSGSEPALDPHLDSDAGAEGLAEDEVVIPSPPLATVLRHAPPPRWAYARLCDTLTRRSRC